MALIYIVEDDEPIRRELIDILARAGFEIEACESFEHVSRDILAAAPDLVLLDLTFPSRTASISATRFAANPRSPSSSSRRARPRSTRSWP